MLSENVSEKRRGRPRAWHQSPLLESMCSAKTERGRANWRLGVFALSELSANWEPSFAWFWHSPPIDTYDELHRRVMLGELKWRGTVLAELGRALGDDVFLEIARELSGLPIETTTRAAVNAIRGWRGRKRSEPADAHALALALARTLDEYTGAHRDTTREQIAAALDAVLVAYDVAATEIVSAATAEAAE